MRQLPSLSALRAFEAAGRHGNLSLAAAELCVTHGAISKQVKLLEATLGMPLIRRAGKGIELTPEGRKFLPHLIKAFDNLDAAVRSMDRRKFEGSLTLSCMPGLAMTWLIPKLSRFLDQYPKISITILPPEAAAAQGGHGVDLEILYGRPDWPDRRVRLLKQLEIFPVCSPAFVSGPDAVHSVADLTRHTLIDNPEGTHWRDFFLSQEMDAEPSQRVLRFHDFTHCLAAARAGLGIAMGDSVTTAEDLAKGTLVRPLREGILRRSMAYYLVTSPDRVGSAALDAFVDWLVRELGNTAEG